MRSAHGDLVSTVPGPSDHRRPVGSLVLPMMIRILAGLGELVQHKQAADAGQERQRPGLPTGASLAVAMMTNR